MSRIPGHSSPRALTPIASTSTSSAGLGSTSAYSGVRHRHDKEPATYPPIDRSHLPAKTQRRKRREGARKIRRLRWRKGVLTEAFRMFGEHCARNQIRTLLIDCLVMTNLFYPSLALYLQKRFPPLHPPSQPSHNSHRLLSHEQVGSSRRTAREHPLSLLSTPVLDSFFPYPPPLLPRLTWAGWWGRDTGQHESDGWDLSRVGPDGLAGSLGADEEIRMMRIGWADVEDVLDRDDELGETAWEARDNVLLTLVRDMAAEWETRYRSLGEGCIRELQSSDGNVAESAGPCYILSPNHHLPQSEVFVTPMTDLSPSAASSNETKIDLSPHGWTSNAGNIYHSFAVLFRVPTNSSSTFPTRWQTAITNVAKGVEGEVFTEAQGFKMGGADQTGQWYISYTSSTQREENSASHEPVVPRNVETLSSTPPKIVLFFYAILFTTLGAQLSNASKVHSRFGLAFTGVVQLCCSSVMSFSVLALLGWNGWGSSSRQSSLPTYILPFVIVVVGAENMSTLTKAIFSIPFNHSVPVRIGLGLSKVGTTIALTSLTDLLLLGVVWLGVNLQPVREFCLFASVVIITDWFMLHTFFLTVLSIDAQRLELADVLASNGVAPITPTEEDRRSDDQSDGKQGGFGWKRVLRARTTKSGSLLLLLVSVGLLYWLTERHRIPLKTTASLYGYNPTARSANSIAQPTSSPFVTTLADLTHLPPAERLWRSLNPSGWPYVRLLVPAASILVLPKMGHSMRPIDIRKLSLPTSRLLLPRLRPLFYLFKVVVLPQALTAGALYALLLYLLKDADLLDAQRDRLGRIDQENDTDTSPGQPSSGSKPSASTRIKAHMLPCSHESDVDIIASSSDGLVAVSVSIDNAVCLWRFSRSTLAAGTREPLQAPSLNATDPIVAAAVSEDHHFVSVCTSSGVVQIWEIEEEGPVTALPASQITEASATQITGLAFDDPVAPNPAEDPFTAPPVKSSFHKDVAHTPALLIAFADGSVISVKDDSTPAFIIPSHRCDSLSCRTSLTRSDGTLAILIATPDSVDIYRRTSSGWLPTNILSTLSDDRITATSMPSPVTPGQYALGHRSGTIELVDDIIGHLVSITPSISHDPVRQVELAHPTTMRCIGCGTTSPDGSLVISSTSTRVYVDRVAPRSPTSVFCRCAARRGSSLDDMTLPNSSSLRHSASNSSLSVGDALVVPPSLARIRNSPGTSPRKSPSLLPPVSNGEFPLSSHGGARRLSNLHKPDEMDHNSSSPVDRSSASVSGSSTSPAGEMEVSPLGAISSVGSGWIVQGDMLVGLRRINEGIDDSQWSIYTVDLTAPFNGSTLVVDTTELSQSLARTQMPVDSIRHVTPKSSATGLGIGRSSSDTKSMTESGSSLSVSMRDRRTERIHSMNGRASFPEKAGVGSFSVPTYEGLGYVEVHQLGKLGSGVIGAFGNKLGILDLSQAGSGSVGGRNRTSSEIGFGTGLSLMGGMGGTSGTAIGLTTPTPRRQGIFPLAPPPSNGTSSVNRRDGGGSMSMGSGTDVSSGVANIKVD